MSSNLLKIVTLIIALLFIKSCFSPLETIEAIRITGEVETPQGLRRGSSVIELVSDSVPKWLPGSSGSTSHLRGESPVVDLGSGKRIFLLLEDEHYSNSVKSLFRLTRRNPDQSLDVGDYPIIVTFTEPNDASSVVKISSADFPAIFGSGYKLRRVSAEPVSEPPTFGVLEEIPLFKNYILKLPIERSIASTPSGNTVPESDPKRLKPTSFQQAAY